MVPVALVVLLLILLVTIAMVAGGGESLTFDLFGAELTISGGGAYIIGLAAGAIVVATLWLLRIGLRKGWRNRKRIRDLERRAGDGDRGTADKPAAAEQGQGDGAAASTNDAAPNDGRS